jgi:hypothetical protein
MGADTGARGDDRVNLGPRVEILPDGSLILRKRDGSVQTYEAEHSLARQMRELAEMAR